MSDPAEIGFVVDVQNDFMRPAEEGGRLYVKDLSGADDPGAKEKLPQIRRAVDWMTRNCDALIFTGDWHSYDDEEIDAKDPDPARGTYPPHCMGLSRDESEREGALLVDEIRPERFLVLPRNATPAEARALGPRAVRDRYPIFVQKGRFDVFEGNAAFGALLEGLAAALDRPLRFHVAGVATDVCVTKAVDGLLARGHAVKAITDAMHGLGLEPTEDTHARWTAAGARLTTLPRLRDRRERTAAVAAVAAAADREAAAAAASAAARRRR
jgi:nicotinamidase-related amidase